MNIAYIGYHTQERYTAGIDTDEYGELLEFLRRKGLPIEPVIWNDPSVDWRRYDVAILKSPWDYHDHILAFYAWLDYIDTLGIRLLNPVDIVKWNSNKRYLSAIAAAGLPVFPTHYLPSGTTLPTDRSLFNALQADQLVIKPCVSAGAKNTIILTSANIQTQSAHINQLLSEEDYLVQPFAEEIANGEWSYLFFNGQYSHCVLKIPQRGDFRVQHYHGGTIAYPEAQPDHILQAARYVQEFAQGTLYARVDGIIKKGAFQLMELEVMEPYLFLNSETRRFENYYQALSRLLHIPH